MEQGVFWMIWGVLAGVMLVYDLRRQHPIRSLFCGAGSGLLALLLVHYGGRLLDVMVPLNPLYLVQATVLGVPGVILLLVLYAVL